MLKDLFKSKITDVERFKNIDTWSLTSESLKEQVIYYFKNYDEFGVYNGILWGSRKSISGTSVGMRGLMSDQAVRL
jgi:hypothetical protein